MRQIATLILLPLMGCGAYSDYRLREEAKAAIAAELSDPGSAEFRNVRVGKGQSSRNIGFVCGEVNGKNSFGAYAGYKRFVFGRAAGLHQVEHSPSLLGPDYEINRRGFNATWLESCEGKTVAVEELLGLR